VPKGFNTQEPACAGEPWGGYAVETAYGRSFDNDSQRVTWLFELYQKPSGELFVDEKKRGKGRKL
jgi:hypothetical protein